MRPLGSSGCGNRTGTSPPHSPDCSTPETVNDPTLLWTGSIITGVPEPEDVSAQPDDPWVHVGARPRAMASSTPCCVLAEARSLVGGGRVKAPQPLAELQNVLRKKLRILCRAEWHRRWGRERARKRAAFIANPFGFTKQLLWDKRSGPARDTVSDSLREQELGPNKALISPALPTTEFNLREPSLMEVEEIIKAAHSASTPGPSGVPYLVYKRCPDLLRHLWKILKVIWRRGRVADQWS
ncbi:hypothetical protein N1851_009945 [Merluccius polli]|uniref:Reverse transcriptase n=1 Tax=Merluccius polli TaxID=89951 RepID=A0AA47P6H9_MERPO|nr:hypothetical protein N1851_009945 [Merluccius polli]